MKEPTTIEYCELNSGDECPSCELHADVEVAVIKRDEEERTVTRCLYCGYAQVNLGEGLECAGQANGEEPMRLVDKLEEYNLLALVGWDDE